MKRLFTKTNIQILVLIIIHLLLLQKIQFTAWPEMLSYPYLLLNGFKNYQDIINPYPPVLPLFLKTFYAFIGLGLLQLKGITYLTIIFIDCLIYLACKKFFKESDAILILLIYIPLQIIFEGNGLWFDLFITPFYLLSFIIYSQIESIKNERNKYYILLGLVLGTAVIIKQTALFLVASIVLFSLFRNRKVFTTKNIITFFVFLSIPLLLSFIPSLIDGTVSEYIFWVFKYPYSHLQSQGFSIYPSSKQLLIVILLFIFSIGSLIVDRNNTLTRLLFVILLASLFYAIPRFSYFHLQVALPFYALLVGNSVMSKQGSVKKIFSYGALVLSTVIFIIYYPGLLGKQTRFYDYDTIRNAIFVGSQLQNKGPTFFYNISSEYFVIGDVLPTKPWADTFPWYLEMPQLQNRIIKSLESENVNYVVMRKFKQESEFTPGSYVPMIINNYISNNFVTVGTVSSDIWILKKKQE